MTGQPITFEEAHVQQSRREAVEETGPEMAAWAISFLIVGMSWVWHRDLFNQVRYVNRDVIKSYRQIEY